MLIHNWPSNFFIEKDGTHVEGEYQAEKHDGHPWRQLILFNHPDPGVCKKLARGWKLTPAELTEWEEVKIDAMYFYIRQKVKDWPRIQKALLESGNEPMTEFNFWHDNFWGNCVCKPCSTQRKLNHLGKIWMEVRTELRGGALEV